MFKNPEWAKFKNDFNRTFTSACEEYKRMKIFLENYEIIKAANFKYENGESEFFMTPSNDTDKTTKELGRGAKGTCTNCEIRCNK